MQVDKCLLKLFAASLDQDRQGRALELANRLQDQPSLQGECEGGGTIGHQGRALGRGKGGRGVIRRQVGGGAPNKDSKV